MTVWAIAGLSLVDCVGRMATEADISHVFNKQQSCMRESINCVERRELQFDSAKT